MLGISRVLPFLAWIGLTMGLYTEVYRPQFHFSPAENWMNDPCGLFYHEGLYHLYFQYNPGGITWGNMSWGHATSEDLSHWEEHPVALLAEGYPGNVTEMYYTGSAVVDTNNTSGFGTNGETPIIAVYTSQYEMTQTLPSGEEVLWDQESQSIAYSLDNGKTWKTYDAGNPVIEYPPSPYRDQYENFRDPFVFWHADSEKWVLVTSLAEINRLVIWTSDNLKDWSVASEFGPVNAVGGVWECPNLFPLPVDGSETNQKWVLIVGLNPGGPPGTVGSGDQYFIGDFNGTAFIPDSDSIYSANTTSNWLDWGPDYYASSAYNGLSAKHHVQLGWMNNWQYGESIPTYPWRSAMAAPRRLSLKTIDGKTYSWKSFETGMQSVGSIGKTLDINLSFSGVKENGSNKGEFGIIVHATSNLTQQTRIGYDFEEGTMFVDRRKSGDVAFDETFPRKYFAPSRSESDGSINLRILVDWSSVEVFNGASTLTAQVFPSEDATYGHIFSTEGSTQNVSLKISEVSSIWT
ncbi:Extracellular exo-inulinase inuE [Penicillium malachiteum]|uniref:Extracellular exo-inulinase inuE n=1 Tax=Penicillium malachiteum TaxID=1324776 RepID=A0AAD6HNW1_9EURO|nr:Extracellular exo-inulinase inuE [Penicillium malachiteum]